MSESNMGTPESLSGDNEPSMEDILASIRKVIAEDNNDGDQSGSTELTMDEPGLTIPGPQDLTVNSIVELETVAAETVAEIPLNPEMVLTSPAVDIESTSYAQAETSVGIIDVAEDDADDDILDLLEIIGDEPQDTGTGTGASADPGEEISPENTTASGVLFDESLDLVMEPVETTDMPQARADGAELEAIVEMSVQEELGSDEQLATVLNRLAAAQELSAVEEEQRTADSFDDIFSDEDLVTSEAAGSGLVEQVVEVEPEMPRVEEISSGLNAGRDEDIDLVKSLLADLMDDPEAVQEEAFADEEPTTDSLITELLDDSFVAENSTNPSEAALVVPAKDEDELVFEEIVSETVSADTPSLAEIAEAARSQIDNSSDLPNPYPDASSPDEIDLPVPGQLATAASLAASAAAVAVIGTGLETDDEDAVDEVQDESLPEIGGQEIDQYDDLDIPELRSEDEISEDHTVHEQVQEEIEMPRIATNDGGLVGGETEQESVSAFASLTSAVKVKAEREESGPPIGDLVQEALKPMLQEWLDKNLKGIVERAVTKEVKRISSGK